MDVDLLVEMFEKHGNEYLTPERIRAEPYQSLNSYVDVHRKRWMNSRPPVYRSPKTSAISSAGIFILAAKLTIV